MEVAGFWNMEEGCPSFEVEERQEDWYKAKA